MYNINYVINKYALEFPKPFLFPINFKAESIITHSSF